MKKILIVIASTLSFFAYSQTPEHFIQQVEKEMHPYNNHLYTVHNTINMTVPFGRGKHLIPHSFLETEYHKTVENGVIRITPLTKKTIIKNGREEVTSIPENKNELMVVFLGLFDNGLKKNFQGFWVIRYFALQGYDVIAYPNTFTKNYNQKFHPQGLGADIQENARYIATDLESKLQNHSYKKIHAHGFSHGSFLGSIVLNFLNSDVKVDTFIATSPPLDIYKSAQSLDEGYRRTLQDKRKCNAYLNPLRKQIPLVSMNRKGEYKEDLAYCADYLFHNWFNDELTGYIKKTARISLAVEDYYSETSKGEIYFQEYIQAVNESLASLIAEDKTNVSFWINALEGTKTIVIASEDDPINTHVKPEELILESPHQVIFFARGGHGGLYSHLSYYRLIDSLL